MIVVSKYMIPRGYNGLTLFPFIFLKNKELKFDAILLNHEKIHLRQQLELLIIPFYLVYVIEFLIRLILYRNWDLAYRNISFEREAYINQSDFQYIKRRSFWSFLKYLRSNDFQSKK